MNDNAYAPLVRSIPEPRANFFLSTEVIVRNSAAFMSPSRRISSKFRTRSAALVWSMLVTRRTRLTTCRLMAAAASRTTTLIIAGTAGCPSTAFTRPAPFTEPRPLAPLTASSHCQHESSYGMSTLKVQTRPQSSNDLEHLFFGKLSLWNREPPPQQVRFSPHRRRGSLSYLLLHCPHFHRRPSSPDRSPSAFCAACCD